jgi:RNA polymerase sigma-70 factor (ECF subfamily)
VPTPPGTTGNNAAAAFEARVRPHLRALYRVAYRLTGRREDAEDLVQDLLAKLYGRRQELDGVEHLRPWLLRVMYRLFVDQHRQHARSPLHLISDPPPGEDGGDALAQFAAPQGNPEADTEQAARNLVLLRAIERLSEDHQRVLALHDVEGYTLEEIQLMLDCPIGTLKSRLHRARARLRELLAEAETTTTVEPSTPLIRHIQSA